MSNVTSPNLSAIGKGLSTREIIAEVLWPNENIKESYNRVAIETKTGELIQGIKIFENSGEIHVETTESKRPRLISKKLIVSKTESGSLMPSGLTDSYSKEELRDLITYLSLRILPFAALIAACNCVLLLLLISFTPNQRASITPLWLLL